MIDEILQAILDEAKAYLASISDDTLGTAMIIKKTNIKDESKNTYTYPLLMIGVVGGAETSQYCGGTKRQDWMFDFSSYHYAPDADVDDDSGYSTGLLKIVDLVTNHFAAGLVNELWLTAGMTTVFNDFCFSFTLSGLDRADPLEASGMAQGWKINMDSIGIDDGTSSTKTSTAVLEHVVHINDAPTDF